MGRSFQASGSGELRGPLPDRQCTPGARFRLATRAMVCRRGYSATVRNVSARVMNRVYTAYGLRRQFNGRDGEVDHLVTLELGGSNSRANLFPEAPLPRPGAHEKDRLENRLHAQACDGRLTLRCAQQLIAVSWTTAYSQSFG